MGFREDIGAIRDHAITAAGQLTPPIRDVAIAFPLPKGRCVRVWWGGEADPVRMGGNRTLSSELVSDRVMVSLYLPVSSGSEALAASYVYEAQAFVAGLRTLLLGDSSLGGEKTDLEMAYASLDIQEINGGWWIAVDAEITTDFTEYPIAK